MIGVIIGRFQPFHNGHLDLIKQGLKDCEQIVIVLGSHNAARSLRNPFLSSERSEMIASALSSEEKARVHFVAVRDYFYKPEFWSNEVREKVKGIAGAKEIALLGFKKDATSSYLDWFPGWKLKLEERHIQAINASPIRENYLRNPKSIEALDSLPSEIKSWLAQFAKTENYSKLASERKAIDEYKASWSQAPYAPVFVTTDALIIQSGHILLIRRGKAPGKGLLALPGGFLDPNESIEDCVLRELEEETQFELPAAEMRQKLKAVRVFDHPLRSSRGRTITHVHYFSLEDRGGLVGFKSGDDAAEAMWMPILDIAKLESEFFEDHFHIINSFLRSY